MKISVVIPTYNRKETIKRAMDSVLSQSYQNFELIIVDDGSTDETQEIINKFLPHEKIKVISIDNSGVSKARNIGIQNADSKWIAFLDSDDEWHTDKLTMQMKVIEDDPDAVLIHTNEVWIRNGKHLKQKGIHKKYGGFIFDKCIPLCNISPSTSLIKKSVLEEVGMFDEKFVVCEDYDLWLKISSKYKVHFIEDSLVNKYGGHDDQLSTMYKAMDYYRVKALDNILDIRELSHENVQLVREMIISKSEILINGYRKHGNKEDLKEIEEIRSKHLVFK
tara:strand:+ start:36606 stop:37439 length:834 start_codon:yes stop_codon:yes gene_type:complete